MTTQQKPDVKPNNPCFSSGPCSKRPGWTTDALKDAMVGRSHRSKGGVAKLAEVIDKSKQILGMPDDYVLGIVPGSDTGAIEMALWSMLGQRGVDVLGWDVFGKTWVADVVTHLKLQDVRVFEADYGLVPDLSEVDTKDRDVVFTWNGTTAGVCVPNGDWIAADREGLTFCDATSAVFAMDIPWNKLDVVTWSWQKALGSEAGHGMLALSPRAVERLETYIPAWPLPKVFRMTKKGKLNGDIFVGKTINTPSMLAVEDCLDALDWIEQIGGLEASTKRSADNLAAVRDWVEATDWAEFIAETPETCSCTSICFKVVDPWFKQFAEDDQRAMLKDIEKLLAADGIAYETANHRDAPPSFRLWGGATIETSDIKAVLPWLDWGYRKLKAERQAQAA